ncbi:unnamed protein product [Fusarium venenatum]|uniref:Uncharacterized protein n=1 Tax=Fusarium venenatum TaxID=56646 RepID=A0A2L2SXT8_9HYPO|nr:uncharacterized protein FVRRES_07190 [Fusarium venenatum]CEI62754.1 unnamed protein product [Fusarium venenatum]
MPFASVEDYTYCSLLRDPKYIKRRVFASQSYRQDKKRVVSEIALWGNSTPVLRAVGSLGRQFTPLTRVYHYIAVHTCSSGHGRLISMLVLLKFAGNQTWNTFAGLQMTAGMNQHLNWLLVLSTGAVLRGVLFTSTSPLLDVLVNATPSWFSS